VFGGFGFMVCRLSAVPIPDLREISAVTLQAVGEPRSSNFEKLLKIGPDGLHLALCFVR
jgi:hypothetical protein